VSPNALPISGVMIAAGIALLLIMAEGLAPARPAQWRRWPLNLGLGALTLIIGRLAAIAAPVAAATWAQNHAFGLLNQFSGLTAAKLIVTILLMDLAIYWQHRAFHRLSFFWRWHSLHHADSAMDVSTGVRFHPLEILLSLGWKSICVIVLGAPPVAVIAFELWLMLGSLIEHTNLRLAPRADQVLRSFWTTPAMHAVHHSAHGADAQHNFSFALNIWDKLFGTYLEKASGPDIGLPA
jgi:sterol desaturase/sphingolipid hydroxylase (fatty acid hydroxylase superfamily)